MTYTNKNFTESPTTPVRHLRARRRASTLRHRPSGVRLSGFGI